MTQNSQLASTLWDLASRLRGTGEPLHTLDVLRCMLFLRYASSGSFRFGREADLLVTPAGSRWSYVQGSARDLAEVLGRACRELEDANPALAGTLAEVDFARIERWDGDRRDRILKQLIEGISRLPDLLEATQVGDLYDSLVMMVAESGRGGVSEMFLSAPLARLMVALLDARIGMRVCDPIAKAGRTLVACAAHALENRLDLTLHGQEPDHRLVALCKMNLLLRGARDVRIEPGNALHSPMLTNEGYLACYDRVISAPPINLAHWGAEDAAADPFRRFPIVPPRQNADYAYILHCLATLEDDGRAVILTDRGVLFRQGGSEEQIRRMLVEGDHFEAVISLPGGLLYGTHIPAALLVLRKRESTHRGNVLFAEIRHSGERRRRHDGLRWEDAEALTSAVLRFEEQGDMSKVVSLQEIAQNQWILNPALYLPRNISRTDVSLAEMIETIRTLEVERDDAILQMDDLVQELAAQLDL
jgi:type I restriction enzyme M protein